MKIKLNKQSYKDINDNDLYEITGTDNTCEITKDLDQWMAIMYSMGDYEEHKVWADTPRKAANLLLKNFDLKLGMETA
jgi:hypothetical protein